MNPMLFTAQSTDSQLMGHVISTSSVMRHICSRLHGTACGNLVLTLHLDTCGIMVNAKFIIQLINSQNK